MPLLTPEQRAAVNRSISPSFLHRSSASSSRSSTPTSIRKNRGSATNTERIQLRRQWANKSQGKREQKDVIIWFKQQFGRVLSSSTISDYLGPKFVYLDTAELSKYKLTLSRGRTAEYKELEEALAEQQLRYNRYPDLGLTTSYLLRIKAREFQDKLPCYARKEPPKFLDSQLVDFKRRYSLKERRRYREGAST